MKALNLHATQTKKSYKKPVLKKIGTIGELTKGSKGGSTDFAGKGGDIG
jgi:hypothetical protein